MFPCIFYFIKYSDVFVNVYSWCLFCPVFIKEYFDVGFLFQGLKNLFIFLYKKLVCYRPEIIFNPEVLCHSSL